MALVALPIVLLGAALAGPPVLQRLSWFGVARVEVSGTHLLAPHQVLAVAAIRPGQSIWEDVEVWEAALRRNPVITEARVSRRLPDGLRIRVREARPVALVEGSTLLPATARGRVLPVDPSRVPVDLPLLRGPVSAAANGQLGDSVARALLREVERLGDLEPALLARVSEIRGTADGELILTLSDPDALLLLPRGANATRLRQAVIVLDDVAQRFPDRSGPKWTPVRVDLRFADQVIVRPLSSG